MSERRASELMAKRERVDARSSVPRRHARDEAVWPMVLHSFVDAPRLAFPGAPPSRAVRAWAVARRRQQGASGRPKRCARAARIGAPSRLPRSEDVSFARVGARAIVGGNPWLSLWSSAGADADVEDARAAAAALRRRAGACPVVLVTLQPGITDGAELALVQRVARATQGRLWFWIRLHPAMLERLDEVRRAFATLEHCTVDEPTELPLPALLGACDAHLTHSSSTVIEAAQFGVRSVVTSVYGAELYQRHIDDERLTLASGGADVVAAAVLQATKRGRAGTSHTGSIDVALAQVLGEAR